jgi:sodium-dependent dicarboxylate transporter 2/3/5
MNFHAGPTVRRFVFCLAAALLATVGALAAGWPRPEAFMSGILVLAAGLWVSEAIPLFATALLVVSLQMLLLANPGGWPGLGFPAGNGPTVQGMLAKAADPIMLLFFGGLLLARACSNEGVDRVLSAWILHPFRGGPRRLLLGVLLMTAFLSMWMSNTATAALAVALVAPVAAALPPGDPGRKALYLAIPVGANVGGMGTPIASPPNALAAKFLAEAGHPISFAGWMAVSVPLMLLLLLLAWVLLARWHACAPGAPPVALPERPPLTRRGQAVLGVLVLTVLLWLSEGWHGLPSTLVGMVPAVLLCVSGLIRRREVESLEWTVLILIAGGIALGSGLEASGLDRRLVGLMATLPLHGWTLDFAWAALAGCLGIFMSNTAATNLILPLAMASVAAQHPEGLGVTALTITFAVATSMLLPGSTPPNALAYASGTFGGRDLLRIGAALFAFTLALLALAGWLLTR